MKHPFAMFAVSAVLSLLAAHARAGCGFYTAPASASAAATALVNDADQVSLMRDGTRFALTMSTNYKGPAEDFAMIVPVPVVLKRENVKTLSPEVFTHLEKLTAPRVVEYEERDPCAVNENDGMKDGKKGGAPGGVPTTGIGGGGGSYGVTIEAQFVIGEYEIVVLSAKESDGLESWLKDHAYRIPDGASAALAPDVAQQQKFVVAKVDSTKVHRDARGAVVLSPLRFVYETTDFRLPVRLGLLNAPTNAKQDLIVYLLARGTRIEAANLANAQIPTNVDVDPKVIPSFAAFYASLLDATMNATAMKSKGPVAITEYAWRGDLCGVPCNAPGLSEDELDKLGADEIFPGADPVGSDLVLTRLHTRYDRTTLQDDIVFRDAGPLTGGGERDPGAESPPPKPTLNAFQARYAVRHPWNGAIACKDPERGIWIPSQRAGMAAVDVAAAPRDVTLASMVMSPIPSLGLALSAPPFGARPRAADVAQAKVKDDQPDTSSPAGTPAVWIAIAATALIACAVVGWLVLRKR